MTRWVFRMKLLFAFMPMAALGYYSPDAGRWTTRDPLEEKGGVNLHAFCENDPVNKYDPMGEYTLADAEATVQVSLYSMNPETHDAITKRPGSFAATKAAIEKLAADAAALVRKLRG